MAAQYRTLGGEIRFETELVKGSRFLASAACVSTSEQALGFVERISAEFHKASHNCWAYRLGPLGEAFRSSDDGEPSGSAGRPILMQIEGHGLSNCAVVVSRWFGGTKLGVGGLMRAYGGAAGQALDQATIRSVKLTRRVRLRFPYACAGAVEALLASEKLEPEQAEYGARVELWLRIAEDRLAGLQASLLDRTAARAEWSELEG